MKPNKKNISKILFITLSNLGDIILTTPVLEKLCDDFPKAKIDVITGESGKDIFVSHPAIKNVMVRRKKMNLPDRIKEIVGLFRKKYDLVVDLKGSLVPYLIRAKAHSGFFIRKHKVVHKREEHLLRLTGICEDKFKNNRFFMPASNGEKRYASDLIGDKGSKKMVVINPGAKSHLKIWDAEKYGKLSDRLISELKCKVYITGGKEDLKIAEQVIRSCADDSIINLCGRTTIGMLVCLIREADLVITNDSAPLHVASAVNAPTIAIFGPSNDKKYGPLSDKSVVLKPKVPCRPCETALCSVGPDEGCISRIEVDEVFRAAKRLLGM